MGNALGVGKTKSENEKICNIGGDYGLLPRIPGLDWAYCIKIENTDFEFQSTSFLYRFRLYHTLLDCVMRY